MIQKKIFDVMIHLTTSTTTATIYIFLLHSLTTIKALRTTKNNVDKDVDHKLYIYFFKISFFSPP